MPALFMGQVLSLVLEGVFVEFPDLRVVAVEGGYSWLPSFLWRIDKVWKRVTDDFPWVERPPSEYVREHMWVATHPLAETEDPEYGTPLKGDEPPVDTYDVSVEAEVVVPYV